MPVAPVPGAAISWLNWCRELSGATLFTNGHPACILIKDQPPAKIKNRPRVYDHLYPASWTVSKEKYFIIFSQ